MTGKLYTSLKYGGYYFVTSDEEGIIHYYEIRDPDYKLADYKQNFIKDYRLVS